MAACAAAFLPILSIASGPASPAAAQAPASTGSVLPSGTTVYVVLDEDLSTATAVVGDRFRVVVSQDVIAEGTTVIPRGAVGWGEVTFVSNRGGFGKSGILGISLRTLELGGRNIALDGRYREEGTSRDGATVATFFVAGVFAGLIKGGDGGIPRGRELKARIGENLDFVVRVEPPPVQALAEAGAGGESDTIN